MSELAVLSLPKFFIFGDFYAGTLMRAAETLGLEFAGGSILAGQHMNDPFFMLQDERFIMTTDTGASRLQKRLSDAGLGENFLDVDMPIVSTVGFNTTNFESSFDAQQLAILNSRGAQTISKGCFRAVVEASRVGALEFYRVLTLAKKTVYAVLSPQRFTRDNIVVCRAFEEVMTEKLEALGVQIVDVRAETVGSNGILRPEFASMLDATHGNDAYGTVVFRKFAEVIAPRPQIS